MWGDQLDIDSLRIIQYDHLRMILFPVIHAALIINQFHPFVSTGAILIMALHATKVAKMVTLPIPVRVSVIAKLALFLCAEIQILLRRGRSDREN